MLRTYRLALITDQSYSTYFGGPANVTAAKVALMNRVNQIYEDETSIRLVLIDDTDKTNLNTDADAIGANGPCGSAPCYTTAQLAGCGGGTLGRNRIVLGQIIGASNYDIGHLGLGKSGGGVANLGVVGGNSKAGGCTGLPNPEGDFYAVDYVAHEMGHQFAGNHTFNGTQLNCAGNKNGGTAVEPGSGSSIMAYAGICRQDDLQPHSDPYWSQRSFEEITNYVTPVRPPINEVQTASLRDFDGTDSFKLELDGAQSATITNGTNYSAAGIQVALQGVSRDPDGRARRLRRHRLVHARVQGRHHGPDRPRPEQHRGRDPERPPGRQRAAAGRADRLQRHDAVVPDRRRTATRRRSSGSAASRSRTRTSRPRSTRCSARPGSLRPAPGTAASR